MLLCLLALASPRIDPPIDFRPDVASVPNVIGKLAKQSGLHLTTNPTVANDVVAIVAPKNSPREIMDQIAYAIEAEWKEAGGEWTLFRSDAVLKDQAARDKALTILIQLERDYRDYRVDGGNTRRPPPPE